MITMPLWGFLILFTFALIGGFTFIAIVAAFAAYCKKKEERKE